MDVILTEGFLDKQIFHPTNLFEGSMDQPEDVDNKKRGIYEPTILGIHSSKGHRGYGFSYGVVSGAQVLFLNTLQTLLQSLASPVA